MKSGLVNACVDTTSSKDTHLVEPDTVVHQREVRQGNKAAKGGAERSHIFQIENLDFKHAGSAADFEANKRNKEMDGS